MFSRLSPSESPAATAVLARSPASPCVRQLLAGGNTVLPFVSLRADRRSRTASVAAHLDTLADRGLTDRVRTGGAFTSVFAASVDVPMTERGHEADAGEVRSGMLEEGDPVLTMDNTVDGFTRNLEDETGERARWVATEAAD